MLQRFTNQLVGIALLLIFSSPMIALVAAEPSASAANKPNIVLILADDLGYGDVSCYNDQSKVVTAHLDRLAAQGMRFTDAHSPATVCTPSRYSIMTGRMCFRTGFRGVFTGIGGPCLIEPERVTLPQLLRDHGYATAISGKWHIGLTFLDQQGKRIADSGKKGIQQVDFTRAIPDAPIHRGFDIFYGTACCPGTDWLYAYVDGDRIPVPPSLTQTRDRSQLPNHPYANDCRDGYIAPGYKLDELDLVFLERSQRFIRNHVQKEPDRPFFLFHSMHAVHLPSFAAPQFHGASKAGPHGDFLMEMDWIVGELMRTLDELGIADNTLVLFGSDNGPEVPTVNAMRKDHQHDGARPWRGVKRDAWEGGHRTPFIARWPARIKPGSTSAELLSLTDIFATCAAIAGAPLPDKCAEDSFNMLPALLGETADKPIRPYLLEQTNTLALSIRKGNWKLLDHRGSGGNDYVKRKGEWGMKAYALPELAPNAPGQLYDLSKDPGETTNLYEKYPQVVGELKHLLDESKASGWSRPRQ